MHAIWPALIPTLRVAAAATVLSLAFGIWLGRLLEGRRLAALALAVPLPPTIVCSYFLVRVFTEPVAIAAATLYWLPALARAARLSFRSIDRRYLDAGRLAGASEWRVFWRIDLPLAARPVLSAAAGAFLLIAAEYAATLWIAHAHPRP